MANVNVFLLSIIVIASLSSLSHCLVLDGLQIGTVEVRGILRCTLDATNLIAPPVPSQTVLLDCGDLSTNLGQAVTDPTGAFKVVVNVLDSVIFTPSLCNVTVNLPVDRCSVFPPTGVLTSTISLVDVVHTNVGNIANYVTGPFFTSII